MAQLLPSKWHNTQKRRV